MKINRNNYEQYFLDHAEGTLSPEMERELVLFLEANPDLKKILEEFDASPLAAEEIQNNSLKNRLKKNIHPTAHIDEAHVDEWLTREVEGLLSESEKSELEVFLKNNPAYGFDRKMYSLARFSPDQSVSFPGKARLKKKVAVITFNHIALTVAAVAAMILLFIGIRFFNPPVMPIEPEIVQAVTKSEDILPVEKVAEGKPEPVPKGTPSQRDSIPKGLHPKGTPSLTPAPRQASFRILPSQAVAINLSNPAESPEPVLYAFAPTPFEMPEEKNANPILGKVFGNMVSKARNAVRSNSNFDKISNPELNIWSIAEAGVKGFNTISDRDIELLVRRDEDGKVKSYALVEEDKLLLSKSLGKN